MFEAPLDLARARILLTNDDGIDAPGLAVLERIARAFTDDIWVVAPTTEQSGVSHSLSLHAPLRIHPRGEHRYAVDGSPTDSVLLAISKIMQDQPPDLVLAGMNQGGNLGDDVTYSGTVAAAMEATILDVPAIALSQMYTYDQAVKWTTGEHYAGDLIGRLTRVSWPTGVFMNINFPDVTAGAVTGIEVVRQGRRKLGYRLVDRLDPRGRPYVWIGRPRTDQGNETDTDLARSASGAITITPMHLDLTHGGMLATLGGGLA
jgi:5'-nucleotidase